jgi:hypothetical protein
MGKPKAHHPSTKYGVANIFKALHALLCSTSWVSLLNKKKETKVKERQLQ